MKDTLRFILPAIGGFLLGVFPGMNWLERYAATSPVMLEAGEQTVFIVALAALGSFAGIAVFRLITWTNPKRTDAVIWIVYTLAFGLVGFMYLLTLVV